MYKSLQKLVLLINEKMEAQVAKMKEAFETTAKEMGGHADVEVNVMYPGFKFADGDHVVEVENVQLKNWSYTFSSSKWWRK